ncbi:hypothetical protein GO491_01375 [Flavobacteriaceae bacterium Ap0902]|nr:hypothetical protein [Flavobacteriaceae bacterium Ap0902]
MKNLLSFLFIIIFSIGYSQTKDTRTFQQINDSILREAHLIYRFDKAFTTTAANIDAHRELRRTAGEIVIMPKNDKLHALVFSKETKTQIVGEMFFNEYIDSTSLITVSRPATADEMKLREVKHTVMSGVQAKYEVIYGGDDTYLNPIFIPYKEKIRDKNVQLYKFYLTTETNKANTIPFGRDYMFIAKEDGSIFYNLQFNLYMPVVISQEIAEKQSVTIEYPEREHYITPTDMYLFAKYGAPKDLFNLRVLSNYLGVYFDYNWDRETLDVVME